MNRDVLAGLVAYPQIWHGCHTHHQRGARSGHPLTECEASLLSHLAALNGEVYNPIFRFLSRNVFGHTGTMDKLFATLKA